MHLFKSLTLLAAAVRGQQLVQYAEPTSGVQYNIAIKEAAAAPFDVYVSVVSPINNTYAAIAFGACMLRSPLVVAYRNGTSLAAAPFWATAYHPPSPYNGSVVTVLKSSSVNATYWTANYVCTGCSTWLGGSVNAFDSTPFGFGVSSEPIASTIRVPYHNVNKGHFEINITNARNTQSGFALLTKG